MQDLADSHEYLINFWNGGVLVSMPLSIGMTITVALNCIQ